VKDASRAVGVAQNLVSEGMAADYIARIKTEYEDVRAMHKGKSRKTDWLTLEQARANKTPVDWTGYAPPTPKMLGLKVFDGYSLNDIAKYIDWTPFFKTWELAGSYPKILKDPLVGEHARQLFDDAQSMLKQIIDGDWLHARAVFGLFPANQVNDDDIELYTDASRGTVLTTLHHLRQQNQKPPGRPNQCLADFVAPKSTGINDYLGAFAVTTGLGIDAHVARFEADHDDYHAIMLKALADRLAEAFAELLHERVRKEFWGYADGEKLSNDALINEEYRGIRPAPGYPACPDHTEKALLWQLIDPVTHAGIELTESFAMWPAAAVSGWYFSHPEARYFGVGKINRDQVEDYARRKGMSSMRPSAGWHPRWATIPRTRRMLPRPQAEQTAPTATFTCAKPGSSNQRGETSPGGRCRGGYRCVRRWRGRGGWAPG
jgi:5-methyltetrahydrofolate--homocysteine methyltransferase